MQVNEYGSYPILAHTDAENTHLPCMVKYQCMTDILVDCVVFGSFCYVSMDHRVFVFFTRWTYIKGKHLDKLGSLHSQQQKLFVIICVYLFEPRKVFIGQDSPFSTIKIYIFNYGNGVSQSLLSFQQVPSTNTKCSGPLFKRLTYLDASKPVPKTGVQPYFSLQSK